VNALGTCRTRRRPPRRWQESADSVTSQIPSPVGAQPTGRVVGLQGHGEVWPTRSPVLRLRQHVRPFHTAERHIGLLACCASPPPARPVCPTGSEENGPTGWLVTVRRSRSRTVSTTTTLCIVAPGQNIPWHAKLHATRCIGYSCRFCPQKESFT